MIARAAGAAVDALKSQPLALALVIINVLFLVAGGFVLHHVSAAITTERESRNALLAQIIASCGPSLK